MSVRLIGTFGSHKMSAGWQYSNIVACLIEAGKVRNKSRSSSQVTPGLDMDKHLPLGRTARVKPTEDIKLDLMTEQDNISLTRFLEYPTP